MIRHACALFLPALLLTSGCVTERSFIIGETHPLLEARDPGGHGLPVRWAIGNVYSRAIKGAQAAQYDYGPFNAALTQRLTSTLSAQTALGERVEATAGPEYLVELETTLTEAVAVNGWMAAAAAAETGVLLGAFGAGAALGHPSQRADTGLSAMLLSVPIALGVALLFPASHLTGEFETTLTLRRTADQVPVSTRHFNSAWSGDVNGYSGNEELKQLSGVGVAALEQKVLEELREALRLQASRSIAAPPAP